MRFWPNWLVLMFQTRLTQYPMPPAVWHAVLLRWRDCSLSPPTHRPKGMMWVLRLHKTEKVKWDCYVDLAAINILCGWKKLLRRLTQGASSQVDNWIIFIDDKYNSSCSQEIAHFFLLQLQEIQMWTEL